MYIGIENLNFTFMSIKIAIADDKQINRTTVKEKIMSFKEIELVLEAKNGHDFLEQLKQLPGEKQPQVVLMDWRCL